MKKRHDVFRCTFSVALLLFFCGYSMPGLANPIAPGVVAGQASFLSQGDALTVQTAGNTIINWQSFSIGAGEAVNFIQPSATSSILLRVTGNDPSAILGTLVSNGNVFLVNTNGIIFGQSAMVDAAGLGLLGGNMTDASFLAGDYTISAPLGGGGSIFIDGSSPLVTGGNIVVNGFPFSGGDLSSTGNITIAGSLAGGGEVILAGGSIITVTGGLPGGGGNIILAGAPVVPEPASLLLLSAGLAGLGFARRRLFPARQLPEVRLAIG